MRDESGLITTTFWSVMISSAESRRENPSSSAAAAAEEVSDASPESNFDGGGSVLVAVSVATIIEEVERERDKGRSKNFRSKW